MDWQRLKAEYIAGGISYRKLAEKYDVPFSNLKRIATRDGWYSLREQAETEATTKMVKNCAAKQAERMNRLFSAADELLSFVEKLIGSLKSDDIQLDKSILKTLSATMKDIKDIQGVKAPLELEEQQMRLELLKKQAVSEKASEIRVIFGDDEKVNEWVR